MTQTPDVSRIREHRLRAGLTQGELARRAGLSASYFNQIELGRRRIGGKRLGDIAAALGIGPAELAGDSGGDLIAALREAAPDGAGGDLDPPEVFASRCSGWARLLVRERAEVHRLGSLIGALNDRLAHDRGLAESLHELLSTVTAIRSSASIIADDPGLDPNWRNRFQRNIIEDSARLADGAQALVDRLQSPGAAPDTGATQGELQAFLSRHAHHFPTLEADGADAIPAIVAADNAIGSDTARAFIRTTLAVLVEESARLPLRHLAAALARFGPDPMAIARETGADLATVLRRIAALPEAMLPGPVGLAVCDMSGTLLRWRGVPGLSLPREGGLCARWPLFTAMAQPFRPIRRVLRPGGRDRDAVLTWTVAAGVAAAPGADLHLTSQMLILPLPPAEDASMAEAVGPTCRFCAASACPVRREPSVLIPDVG